MPRPHVPHPLTIISQFVGNGECVVRCQYRSVSKVKKFKQLAITYPLSNVTMTSQRRNVYVVGVGMTKVRAPATS